MKLPTQPCALCACLFAMALSAMSAHTQSVTPVPKLDVSHFTGTWYEIAHYPTKRYKHCVGTVIDLIAFGDKARRLQFVSSCVTRDGYTDARNATGKLDKAGDGKVKVSYTFPFSTKFWVLSTAPDYEWMLVGSPNHKNLWILSHARTLDPAVLSDIESKATAEGFSTAKLIMAPQAPPK